MKKKGTDFGVNFFKTAIKIKKLIPFDTMTDLLTKKERKNKRERESEKMFASRKFGVVSTV